MFQKSIILLSIIASTLLGSSFYGEGSGLTIEDARKHAFASGLTAQLVLMLPSSEVKEACSVLVADSSNLVKNLSEEVLSKEFGRIKVALTGEVLTQYIEERLLAKGTIKERFLKPLVSLEIAENIAGKPSFEKSAHAALQEKLLEYGFRIAPSDHTSSTAPLIIRGEASSSEPSTVDVHGVPFHSVGVRVSAELVEAGTGKTIVRHTTRMKINGQESFSVTHQGLESAGYSIATLLMPELMNEWIELLHHGRKMRLIVESDIQTELRWLENKFQSHSAVRSIELLFIDKGKSHYTITLDDNSVDIRLLISELTQDWEISSLSHNQIALSRNERSEHISQSQPTTRKFDIVNVTCDTIFPAHKNIYLFQKPMTVTLKKNKSELTSHLQVDFSFPALLSSNYYDEIDFSKKEVDSFTIPFAIDLNKALQFQNPSTEQGLLQLSSPDGSDKKIIVPITVQEINSIDWNKPRMIGSFVTYRNSSIDRLSRKAVSSIPVSFTLNRKLEDAAALFTLLSSLNLRYIEDPVTTKKATLDRIQFPIETIERKGGDCDDLSTLFIAMLTAVGVESALISTPSHVFVLFNTGVFEKNRYLLGVEDSLVIIHKGQCWIPVETTLLDQYFHKAWQQGITEYHRALQSGEPVEITDITEALSDYPPLTDGRIIPTEIPKGLSLEIETALKNICDTIDRSRQAEIVRLEKKETLQDSELFQLGRYYLHKGEPDKTVALLKGSWKSVKSPLHAKNNYACALLLSGQERDAQKILSQAFNESPLPEIKVNLALCKYIRSKTEEDITLFVQELQEALPLLANDTDLEKYLGLELYGDETQRATEKEKKTVIDRERLKRLIQQRVLKENFQTSDSLPDTKVTVLPFGGIRGTDPASRAELIELLYWFDGE